MQFNIDGLHDSCERVTHFKSNRSNATSGSDKNCQISVVTVSFSIIKISVSMYIFL